MSYPGATPTADAELVHRCGGLHRGRTVWPARAECLASLGAPSRQRSLSELTAGGDCGRNDDDGGVRLPKQGTAYLT
jgi:hypothetical protein